MSKHSVGFIGDGQEADDDGSDSSDPAVPIDLSIDTSSRAHSDGIIVGGKESRGNFVGVNTQFASKVDESPVDLVRRRSTRLSKSSSDGSVSTNVLPTQVWSVCELCDATLSCEEDLQEHLRVTHKVTKKFNGLRQVFLPFTGTRPVVQSASTVTSQPVTRQSVIISGSSLSTATSNLHASSSSHETRQYHRQNFPQNVRSSSSNSSATSTATATSQSQGHIGPSASVASTSTTGVQTGVPVAATAAAAVPSQDGRFPCGVCGKQLSSRAALIGHLRVHTGEKPHQCSVCSRSFSSSQTLTRHLRTHTGEKPYECPICGKRASLRHNMKLHMKIHQKDKRYSQ